MRNSMGIYITLFIIVCLDVLWIIKCIKRHSVVKAKKKHTTKKPWILGEDDIGNAIVFMVVGNIIGIASIVFWFGSSICLGLIVGCVLLFFSFNILLLASYYLCRFVKIDNNGIIASGLDGRERLYRYSEIKKIRLKYGGAIIIVPGNVIFLDANCNWIVLKKYLIDNWDRLTYKHRLVNLLPDGKTKNVLLLFIKRLDAGGVWTILTVALLILPVILLGVGDNTIVPYDNLLFNRIVIKEAKIVYERGSNGGSYDYYIFGENGMSYVIKEYYHWGLSKYFWAIDIQAFSDSLSGQDEVVLGYIEKNGELQVYEITKDGIQFMTYENCIKVNNRYNMLSHIIIIIGVFLSVLVFISKVLRRKQLDRATL